jgi:hypothetical protein
VNPRHSLIIALILALLDGIETYIAVFKMDATEVMMLTRILLTPSSPFRGEGFLGSWRLPPFDGGY